MALNPIRAWFFENLTIGGDDVVDEEAAYTNFKNYALLKGYRRLDRSAFRITMREIASKNGFK